MVWDGLERAHWDAVAVHQQKTCVPVHEHGGGGNAWRSNTKVENLCLPYFLPGVVPQSQNQDLSLGGRGGGYMDDLWIYEETRPLIIRIYKPQSSQILISPENLWIHHIY